MWKDGFRCSVKRAQSFPVISFSKKKRINGISEKLLASNYLENRIRYGEKIKKKYIFLKGHILEVNVNNMTLK
jgi:hypothetical protein